MDPLQKITLRHEEFGKLLALGKSILHSPCAKNVTKKRNKKQKDCWGRSERRERFWRGQQGKHLSCPQIWWTQCLNVLPIALNNFEKNFQFFSFEKTQTRDQFSK